jgi:hypothetical protein
LNQFIIGCQGQLKIVQKWQFENVQLWQFRTATYGQSLILIGGGRQN